MLGKLYRLLKISQSNSDHVLELPTNKIKISDNVPMNDDEFDLVCRICDVLSSIEQAVGVDLAAPPSGGQFWHEAREGRGPYGLHIRKDRNEIDHSFLLNTRFRDFPSVAYDSDDFTPTPDYSIKLYLRLKQAIPKKWHVKIPARFGEIGWNIDGYPVNRLTGFNQERISVMYLSGLINYLEKQRCARILEIGGGAGEMAYVFGNALPNCTWYDADLVGSLAYNAIHMAVMLPRKNHYIYVGDIKLPSWIDESLIMRSPKAASDCQNAVINIPHFLLPDFADHLNLHMAYNAYSFGEMPSKMVDDYAALLAKFLDKQGGLIEQNVWLNKSEVANTRESLSKHLHEWSWTKGINGNLKIHGGETRTWSRSKAIADEIKQQTNLKIVKNISAALTSNSGEHDDTQFEPDMWEWVNQSFPASIL